MFKNPTRYQEVPPEFENLSLKIEGKFPEWLSGTLVRNGPVPVSIDNQCVSHWFDGLAMLHSFHIHEGKVNYTNKFLRSKAYETVFKEGSLNYEGFASDPCRSIFKKIFTLFFPQDKNITNANVNIAKYADAYVALTETPLPVHFDIKTLKTLGVFDYADELPKERCFESAHPHHDVQNKETINYIVKYGPQSTYLITRMSDGSKTRKTIAEIEVKNPAYMHSFALTKNYIILTEFPFIVSSFFDMLFKNQGFIKNFSWKPELGTRFTVINRKTGQVLFSEKTEPFFAFHHANAFEQDNQIVMDIVTYPDASIITDLADFGQKTNKDWSPLDIKLKRFSISLETKMISQESIFENYFEFPRFYDEKYDGYPYQYLYGIDPRPLETNDSRAIFKIDVNRKEVKKWLAKGGSPGEPIFVKDPDGKNEDDGVILAIVLDGIQQTCYLLILDAVSLTELGKAYVPYMIPDGLHGRFFKKQL